MKSLSVAVRGLPPNVTKPQVRDYFTRSSDIESCVVGPIVGDDKAAKCSTTVTLQKKKHSRSWDKIRDSFNGSAFHGSNATTISVSDDFLGLTALAGEPTAPIHLYFVHGLGGHAFNTWSSEIRHEDLNTIRTWPQDFLPDRLHNEGVKACVYTIGYNANLMKKAAKDATIESAAEDLLARLYGAQGSVIPQEIYFVCHSLGGLVVCQALAMALFEEEDYPNKPQFRNLFLRGQECLVKGVTFFGTPFSGSGYANLFGPLIKAIRQLNDFTAIDDDYLRALNTDQPVDLTRIVDRFHHVVHQRNLQLVIGCEERPSAGSKLVTNYSSAVNRFGTEAMVFRVQGRDHRSMVRFGESGSAEYTNLENLIVRMIKNDRHLNESTAAESAQGSSRLHQTLPRGSHQPSPERDQYWARSAQQININLFGSDSRSRDHSPHIMDGRSPGGTYDRFAAHRPATAGGDVRSGKTNIRRYDTQEGAITPLRWTESSEAIRDTDQSLNDMQLDSRAPRRQTYGPSHTSHNDNDRLFNRLIMFDTVFILDDTGSMDTYLSSQDTSDIKRWQAAKEALIHIGRIATSKDPDGVDLRFLKSDETGDNITDIDDLVDKLACAGLDELGGGTFFYEQLEGNIEPRLAAFRDYKQQLKDYHSEYQRLGQDKKARARLIRPKEPKKLNLIVITDGSADDEQEVESYIIGVARELDLLGATRAQIGIQFVQIGDDPDAARFLKHLDDELQHRTQPPIRDIVDMTPFNSELAQKSGSFEELLEKVLLGAVTKAIDERENITKSPISSGPSELH